MSTPALKWAMEVPVPKASAKLVLIYMADYAGDGNLSFQCVSKLSVRTGLDRKTIITAITYLEQAGYVRDTGEKRGATNKIVVYELLDKFNGIETVPKTGSLNSPKNGIVKQSRKRNSPESGTVPKTDIKQYRKRTLNSTENGTQIKELDLRTIELKESQRNAFTDEDKNIAEFMLAMIRKFNPAHKQPNLPSWANDIRLLRERDKRSMVEIRELFVWANADDFWRGNILSPAKLRLKWDQLVIQRQRNKTTKRNSIDEYMRGCI